MLFQDFIYFVSRSYPSSHASGFQYEIQEPNLLFGWLLPWTFHLDCQKSTITQDADEIGTPSNPHSSIAHVGHSDIMIPHHSPLFSFTDYRRTAIHPPNCLDLRMVLEGNPHRIEDSRLGWDYGFELESFAR
jgi:hypothetical protein